MIKRIWHGWTKSKDADSYEKLLKDEIFPGIAAKGILGYREVHLLRRGHHDEVEFVTIMTFDSWDSIKHFVGDDPSVAYVPATARKILLRWDEIAWHYEVREHLAY